MLKDLFFTSRFFIAWGFVVLFFLVSYFIPWCSVFSYAAFALISLLCCIDYSILFFTKKKIRLSRTVKELWSNAEENKIVIILFNEFKVKLNASIIDEIPIQFQRRDFELIKSLQFGSQEFYYKIKPTERGEYIFGAIHAYISTPLQLIQKRYSSQGNQKIKVYPSFLQLRNYQLFALPNVQAESGNRQQFRRGMSTEFDQIKEYTRGDDVRTINWKASARKNALMVNSFMDEKSQQIYCIIDKGRLMKMPFDYLTLLDYSINASLMFAYVALQKEDKVGLITFAEKVHDVLQPSKNKKQFNFISETLYKQQTRFLESNFEDLYSLINKKAGQRSLLLLFTNFETYIGFERQLNYLKALNRKHVLCLILFENTEVSSMHKHRNDTLEDIYIKTIADKFLYEKKMIIKELQKNGIIVIYTTPQKLTINLVNKYVELKAKQFI